MVTVYFDMDGVLADFDRGVRELCGRKPNVQGISGPKADDEMWEAVSRVEHFYDRLEPIPGAIGLFQKVLKTPGIRCEILSGIPKPHHHVPTAGEDKIRWARRLLSETVKVNIVYREQKPEYCSGPGSVLIDDYEKNIGEWQQMGGTGLLFKSVAEMTLELEKRGILPPSEEAE